MQTLKKIFAILALVIMASCAGKYYYQMVTTITPDGKVHRDIYALDRQVYEKDDVFENPFLFNLNSDWNITRFDTVIKHNAFRSEEVFNVKISKSASSIEDYSKEIQCEKDMQSLAKPEESLLKKFRWFYTYYSFKTVYKKLQYKAPIPIDEYLNKEEQLFWTQENTNDYKDLNGYEMSIYLDEINSKFMQWSSRNYFEISLECIKKLTLGYNLDTADKENIYEQIQEESKAVYNINPENICNILDSFYKTTYFSKLYESNKELLDNDFRTKSLNRRMEEMISYELVLPDKIIQTNAPIIQSDTLIWNIDGMRLLFDDYTLTAEYRIANKWAFILSGLIIILAVGSVGVRVVRGRG